MAPDSIRVGVLGAAQIVPAALIEPAAGLTDVTVTAVAARDSKRAALFAAQHGIARVAGDYAELIADPNLDLIYNALPVSEHARWSIDALAAGKSVLCEKPLAMNADEARAMYAAAGDDQHLIEAFHCRYHPAFDTLREWLRDPAAGKVVSLRAHFDVGIVDNGANIRYRPELGGGAMMDLGCYPLLWVRFVMDAQPEVTEAVAAMTATGVDQAMQATLRFGSGVSAEISCSMAASREFSNALSVVTEHSRIEFHNPLLPQHGRLERHIHGRMDSASLDSGSTYAHQLKAVVTGLRSGASLPTEGQRMLNQQEALDQVYAAAGLRHLRYR